jgi:hypothetical protein
MSVILDHIPLDGEDFLYLTSIFADRSTSVDLIVRNWMEIER